MHNFSVTNYIFVQIRGVDSAVKIEADSIDPVPATTGPPRLILKKNSKGESKQVGEIDSASVVGWWISVE